MQTKEKKGILIDERGFTLMELIIVMTILAILVTLAMLYYGNLTNDARRVALLADLNAVDKAELIYESRYDAQPTIGSSVDIPTAAGDCDDEVNELPKIVNNAATVMLKQIDPTNANFLNSIKKTTFLFKPGLEAGDLRGAGKVYIVDDSPAIATGVASAAGASTITLAAAGGSDDFYKGAIINITSGTGAGQSRTITGYVDATKVVTVDKAWAIPAPIATDTYEIYAPVKKGDIVFFQTAAKDSLKIYDESGTQLIYKY